MGMANDADERRRAIATAISVELERQARTGVARINVDALAVAVDEALCPPPPLAEGKHPDELNSTNDD